MHLFLGQDEPCFHPFFAFTFANLSFFCPFSYPVSSNLKTLHLLLQVTGNTGKAKNDAVQIRYSLQLAGESDKEPNLQQPVARSKWQVTLFVASDSLCGKWQVASGK